MRVGLGNLHCQLFVDVIAERRLDEILGITDHLVLKCVRRMVKLAVQPAAAVAYRGRRLFRGLGIHLRRLEKQDSGDPRPTDKTNHCMIHARLPISSSVLLPSQVKHQSA